VSLDAAIAAIVRAAVEDAVRPLTLRLSEMEAAVRAAPPVEWLTVAQAATMLTVRPATVRAWLDRGLLTAHGTRRALRVARRELVAMQPDAGGAEVVDLDKRAAEIVARRRAR